MSFSVCLRVPESSACSALVVQSSSSAGSAVEIEAQPVELFLTRLTDWQVAAYSDCDRREVVCLSLRVPAMAYMDMAGEGEMEGVGRRWVNG